MGGHVFAGRTESIKREDIPLTVENYFETLKKIFPQKQEIFNLNHFTPTGSVGKKPVSGDIDFAIDLSDIVADFSKEEIEKWNIDYDETMKLAEQFQKRARSATKNETIVRAILSGIAKEIESSGEDIDAHQKKITSGNMFTVFPQYDADTEEPQDYGVQIDWMVGDKELLQFSYYSDSYEGNVKGLHRTQALLAMFLVLGYSFNHTKGLFNRETSEQVAKKPTDMLRVLSDELGTEITEPISQNYFKLVDIFKKSEHFDDWENAYFKILDSTRADIPEDLQDDWKRKKDKLGLTGKFLPEDSKLIHFLSEEALIIPIIKSVIEEMKRG
jgi:hypothetical protein